MGDFEEKLESILNNPQAMGQILSLVQSLSGTSSQPASSQPAPPPPSADSGLNLDPRLLSSIATLLGEYNSNDDQQTALLQALRPFVKERRFAKLDKAIQIAKLSRMARLALEIFRAKEEPHV